MKRKTQTYICPDCNVAVYNDKEFERHCFRKHGKHRKVEQFVEKPAPPATFIPEGAPSWSRTG